MTDSPDGVVDAGFQAERTALAWRRTALALAVAAVGAGRLAAPTFGPVAVALAGLGLVQAALIGIAARWRYLAIRRSLGEGICLTAVRSGAFPMTGLVLSALAVAVLALAVVLG